MNRRISGPTIALVAATLAAVGLAAGLLLGPDPAVAGTTEVAVEQDLPAVEETFDDRRLVAFTPIWGPAATLAATDLGRVTRTACQIGVPIESGSSPLTVADRPTIALATEIPLWRDLAPGSRGEDVRAVQLELQRLGFPVETTGLYGPATRNAVRDLFVEAGQVRPNGSLPVSRVIWLPDAQVVPGECPLGVGDSSDAAAFAKTESELVGLQVASGIEDAVPGARIVRLSESAAPVDASGRVTDPAFLAAVDNAGWINPELGASNVELDFLLANPLNVTVVPASALFGLSGTDGCIMVDGAAQQVQVVASRLGRTMVELGSPGPAPTVVQPPPADQSCP